MRISVVKGGAISSGAALTEKRGFSVLDCRWISLFARCSRGEIVSEAERANIFIT